MEQFIRKLQRIPVECYYLDFTSKDDEINGFSFQCDKDGNVFMEELTDCAKQSLHDCLNGTANVYEGVVRNCSYTYIQPAIRRCSNCERPVELISHTNTCTCEWEYNLFGQLLAPRNQW